MSPPGGPSHHLSPLRPNHHLLHVPGLANPLKRSRTSLHQDDTSTGGSVAGDKELDPVEERRQKQMGDLYARSNRMIAQLFNASNSQIGRVTNEGEAKDGVDPHPDPSAAHAKPAPKRPARLIDEDDYGDGEDDDGESVEAAEAPPAKRLKPNSADESQAGRSPSLNPQLGRTSTNVSSDSNKSPEEMRKQLEEEKKNLESIAKESFLTTIFTLENDRDAMLEQQKLDELDRQVETEMSGQGQRENGSGPTDGTQQGSLSSANLGASSLALKHLIARIDQKRDMVSASDAKLRSLMSDVRKNRSKWASEEKIGQEELYEAAERVLMDLKSMTEYAAPFLQRVSRREAPDYYKVITKPMDIGTMIKKMKGLEYKSKKEFVADLDLIWANCFKYNADPNHFLRKKADHMKKETSRLVPLIPDIVIKDRAEVEAEERRAQIAELDDSDDDDQPIVATRGRKAPSKKGQKGGSSARKAPPVAKESTPAADTKPLASGVAATVRGDHLRSDADSVADGSQHGLSTPPPGLSTPNGAGGTLDSLAGAAGDVSEIDGLNNSMNGVLPEHAEELGEEDEEYKTWKQVTKKDRAQVASGRHRLFKSDRLNIEEPALLRNKAGMRRFTRQQKKLTGEDSSADGSNAFPGREGGVADSGTTLAEGIDGEDDCTLPDYYYPLSGVPTISERLRWTEDSDGHVIDRREECLRLVPEKQWVSNGGVLASKMESNMRQMQETRKVMAKIGMVKQMQLQTQTYQNQFQKYEPEPLAEVGIAPTVTADEDPLMAPWLSRAALQRSIGKLFYHAGFEDYGPAALDAMTDVAADHFQGLVHTLKTYIEAPKTKATTTESVLDRTKTASAHLQEPEQVSNKLRARFTTEEALLHTLQENGHDLEGLTSYIEEDIPRLGTKLAAHHENVRQHFADLVRPALDPALQAQDGGSGAFADGSEAQFVAGDFAEDIDEDFFGFKAMGLDTELGITGMSVPLHLLQSRMLNAYQPANISTGVPTDNLMEEPPKWEPVTEQSLENEIALVHEFFKEKLEKAGGGPLVEDEELPAKQRFPKPRLPPTGKISSPRKRPIREQQMLARKKRRMEMEAEREREREESGLFPNDAGTLNNSMSTAEAGNGTADASGSNEPVSAVITQNDKTADDARRGSGTLTNGNLPNGAFTNGDAGHSTSDETVTSGNTLAKGPDRIKLNLPSKDGKGQEGDPTKKPNARNNETSEGADRDQDGILSPESVPIAAH